MAEYPLYKDNVFSVTPIATRVTLNAGESYSGYIRVVNPNDATKNLQYKVKVVPYDYEDDGETILSDYSGVEDWVTIDRTEGDLAPNGIDTINYTITVPEDATGGGHYCALSVENIPNEEEQANAVQIKDILELNSVLYITVNGEVLYGGDVLQVAIPDYSATALVTTNVTLNNTGNIHQDALVEVKATNHMDGSTVKVWNVGEVIENPEKDDGKVSETFLILPGNTRSVNVEVEGLPEIGVYDLTETVYYDNKEVVSNHTVVLCPIWLICLVAGILLAIIAGIVITIVVKRKKRRKCKGAI